MRGKKGGPLKPPRVTDGAPHLRASSEAVPGKRHDKNLSAPLQTVDRVPDGGEAEADTGSQGLAEQGSQGTGTDPQTGAEQQGM